MIEAKCPKCGSTDFDINDIDGGVNDSKLVYDCFCMEQDCDAEFVFICNQSIKSVEITNE